MLAWLFDQPTPERHDPPAAALRCIQPRKTVGPRPSLSSSVLRRLVTQDKDLEVLGGVTAAELGEERCAHPWLLGRGCLSSSG